MESITDEDDDENDDENDDVMEVDLTDGAAEQIAATQKQSREITNKRLSLHLGKADDPRSKRDRAGRVLLTFVGKF